jgi:methyl-accepting chemotaxis protein
MQAATGNTATALKAISQTINKISEISVAIASAVEEQAAATKEVTSNIDGTTQAIGETSQAAGNVLSASGELATNASELEVQVDKFLVNVPGDVGCISSSSSFELSILLHFGNMPAILMAYCRCQ